jgi:hypothetical protein
VWVTGGSRRRVNQENPPMRIYIIGNDGIRLCREASATVNDGEVAVASKEELHAAPLSGKRLLALWNALPGVEKRRTVGNRGALIDRLWPAIEDLPDPELEPDAKRPSKQDEVIAMLRRPEGATVDELASKTTHYVAARTAGKTRAFAGRSSPFAIHGVLTASGADGFAR